MQNAFDLTGRRAIITGGGGGIGGAIAEGLYEAGADILIIGRSESAGQAATRIGSDDRPALSLVVDLSDRTALQNGFEGALDQLGGIDILVTSHGAVEVSDSLEHDINTWDRVLEVNLTSVFLLCQMAARRMVVQGSGKIINIASMYFFFGGLRVASYTASKGGVAQLTKALANEWASKGVNVNAIAPGYVRTQLNEHIWKDPTRSTEIVSRLPIGRWADPDDLKGPAVFLASDASDYLHGVILPVDGGFLAR